MSRVRLVILDVEGVLVLPGGGQYPWPLEDLLALRRFLAGTPLAAVLCTGRQQPYGEAVIQALDLFTPLPEPAREHARAAGGPDLLGWPSIMENGAYFYDPLAKRPFRHPAITEEQAALVRRAQAEALLPLAARTGAVVEAGKDYSLSLNPPPAAPGSRDRLHPREFLPEVEAALAPYGDALEVKYSASAVDLTPRGVSKATAVQALLAWTGLRPDEVLGIGDTGADEAWLREVGWRAAPANGREALPGLEYYAAAPVAAGVLEILERLAAREYAGL